MSGYVEALRNLAEILEVNPGWLRMASFNVSALGVKPVLGVHPNTVSDSRTIRRTLLPEDSWDSGTLPGTHEAKGLLGFHDVTVFEARG